ncbi:sigma-70 family RNA polymerase sigma factor [Heliorestis acidaminivorans]|uniref:Sigma-70 family RNA polymerase sigma factor n=1 Tax=Heliorestis acidaminivorans TaxID=553427 RepID=A0A6I0EPW6_9FIRM|nr:sigma-70 family RNA polymerase sigma factor [Heliorestis acidaminivorans]KAB2951311.1 sigma-70 family RNA polymerase sigma factor [Heliorestis acidaminivorans]
MQATIAPEKKKQPDLDEAVEKYWRENNEEHLAQVVYAARNLIYHFAKLYGPEKVSEDLIQSGYEGLIKAMKRFDPMRGVKFSTYASHYIMGEIRHYIRKEASYCRPVWIAELQQRIDKVIEESVKTTGVAPTHREIAEQLNVREEGVVQALRAGWVSLDQIDTSQIRSMRYENFRLPIEDKIVLEDAVERLTDLQRRVIALLYYGDMTQTEAAQVLGISQRKVSRLLQQSLGSLSKVLT